MSIFTDLSHIHWHAIAEEIDGNDPNSEDTLHANAQRPHMTFIRDVIECDLYGRSKPQDVVFVNVTIFTELMPKFRRINLLKKRRGTQRERERERERESIFALF